MKRKSYILAMIAAFFSILMLGSCYTSSSCITRLERLSNDLRDNSAYYTIDDWKDRVQTFGKLRERISHYNYTPAERHKIGVLEGQCAKYMIQGAKTGVINGISSITSEIYGIVEGFQDLFNTNKDKWDKKEKDPYDKYNY